MVERDSWLASARKGTGIWPKRPEVSETIASSALPVAVSVGWVYRTSKSLARVSAQIFLWLAR